MNKKYEPFIEDGIDLQLSIFSQGVNHLPIEVLMGNQELSTPLCNIMQAYGSDKGGYVGAGGIHNYSKLYYFLLRKYCGRGINILEFGIGTNNEYILSSMGKNAKPGASLYGWRHFLLNAKIFGVDIDKNILFQDKDIETRFCNVTNKESLENLWNIDKFPTMDVMIDDCVHEKTIQLFVLENTFKYLKKDGIYIIEDAHAKDLPWFEEKLSSLNLETEFKFNCVRIFHPLRTDEEDSDNCVVLIKKV